MRGLIACLRASISVAVTVGLLAMSAHGQVAEEIPGSKQIDRRAMQEVCESSATISIDPKGHFQCDACPSYTDFHGNRESFDLLEVYQGHFSTTKAEQLLLVLIGCEPHVSGFGGSILLTRDGTVWKKSNYFKGHKPLKGLSFTARDGLDYLVSLGGDQHYDGSASWISAVSYKDNSLREDPCLQSAGIQVARRQPVTVMSRTSPRLKRCHQATVLKPWLRRSEVWRRPVRNHAAIPKSPWSRRRP